MKEPIKVHGLLIEAVALALHDIFATGRHADKVIEYYLKKQKKWGSRDRRFFAESVYEMVRWWRYLWWLKGEEPQLDVSALKHLWALWWTWSRDQVPESFESIVSLTQLKERLKKPTPLAIRHSIPDWLYQRGQEELGKMWEETLVTLNQPARVYLRVNHLKIKAAELITLLKNEGIEVEVVTTTASTTNPMSPAVTPSPASSSLAPSETLKKDLSSKKGGETETLVLAERKNVFATQAFQKGFFEVQDWSSQQVAPQLEVAPGMRVIDACAGAGGKTLHLAALMKNKGKIIAMDIHEWKLKELRKRSSRNGVDIIEVKLIEGLKTIKRLAESADRVLLDVPCSGIGVLRRNPDAKWKLAPEELLRLQELQREILFSYSKLVKPGGQLVYSTCSIFPSENEKQVQAFLEKNSEFTLHSQRTILPQENNSDGFFIAVLKRH